MRLVLALPCAGPGRLQNDSASVAALAAGMTLGNNTIYAPDGNVTISCGSQTIDAATFHSRGYDRGTVVRSGLPSNETIIAWAQTLLRSL